MSLLISIIAVCLLLSVPGQAPAQEEAYNASFCSSLGGETEVRHEYTYPAGRRVGLLPVAGRNRMER